MDKGSEDTPLYHIGDWGPGEEIIVLEEDNNNVKGSALFLEKHIDLVFMHPLVFLRGSKESKESIVLEMGKENGAFFFPGNQRIRGMLLNKTQSAFAIVANVLQGQLPSSWNVIKPPINVFVEHTFKSLPSHLGARMWPFERFSEIGPQDGKDGEEDDEWEMEVLVRVQNNAVLISWNGESLVVDGVVDPDVGQEVGKAILGAVRISVGYNVPFQATCCKNNVVDVQLIPKDQKVADNFWKSVADSASNWRVLEKMENQLFQLKAQPEVEQVLDAQGMMDPAAQVLHGKAQKFAVLTIADDSETETIPEEIARFECIWKFVAKNKPPDDAHYYEHLEMLGEGQESGPKTTLADLIAMVTSKQIFHLIDASPKFDGDDERQNATNRDIAITINNFFIDKLKATKGLPIWEGPYMSPPHETGQFYIGAQYSSTPTHRDKGSSVSYNVLLQGKKVWLFIEARSTLTYIEKFEKHNVGAGEAFMATTQELNKCNIEYYVVEQNRGDCIVVPPNVFHMVINVDKGVTVAYAWDIIPQDWAHAAFRAQLMRSLLYEEEDNYFIHFKIVEIAHNHKEQEARPALVKVAVALFKIHLGYVELLKKLGWTVEVKGEYNDGESDSITCSCCLQPCLWGNATPVVSNPGYKLCLGCFYKVYVGFGGNQIKGSNSIHQSRMHLLIMPKIVTHEDLVMEDLVTAENQERESSPPPQKKRKQDEK
jgi:hypothetical protein